MNKIIAFHNKQSIKDKYIARVRKHYELDEIVQGVYWENGKGCAVGCTIQNDGGTDNWHTRFEKKLGVPRVLARLEDAIFEGLLNKDAKEFPLQFLDAINVGADLEPVFYKFMIWLLIDKKDGVIQYARPDGAKAIKCIAKLLKDKMNGKNIKFDTWMDVRNNAHAAAAADTAAYTAAAAYAAPAAAAAAAAAADTAAAAYTAPAAAGNTIYAAAYAAPARKAHYKKMANKLIELLREAK